MKNSMPRLTAAEPETPELTEHQQAIKEAVRRLNAMQLREHDLSLSVVDGELQLYRLIEIQI